METFVDPFAPEERWQDYPPVAQLQQLVTEPRAPLCGCARVVKPDGTIRVWHGRDCTPTVLDDRLAAIL